MKRNRLNAFAENRSKDQRVTTNDDEWIEVRHFNKPIEKAQVLRAHRHTELRGVSGIAEVVANENDLASIKRSRQQLGNILARLLVVLTYFLAWSVVRIG
jgi:hypothetical protein